VAGDSLRQIRFTALADQKAGKTAAVAGSGAAASAAATPAAPAPRKDDKPFVAVFDIQDASGKQNPEILNQLTEYLATRLTESGGFRIVPRDQLRSRLSDAKADSHRECFDQSCQIELGKAIAAQKSLATKLLQVANTCAITTTL
jgi:curli biogenesis system outer membrane secretion channel CsgG